jgi:hypothetical protein
MCVIAAKYLKDHGWVLAKNRDQDYISNLSFRDEIHTKVGEIFTMYDHDIDYQEGITDAGMVIITTSLTPRLLEETNKEDGENIYKALQISTPEAAAQYLIRQKMTGYIFIATQEKLILVEAAKEDQGLGEYKSTMRIVPKTETVVRTNHGIDLPWAGFQTGYNDNQDMWRKSSENRMKIAEQSIKSANTPEEMIDALSVKKADDLQMNVFRCENKPRQMRTIFQWALCPKHKIVWLRPVQVKMKLKFTQEKVRVELLDNETLKKIYDGRIKHFARIEQTGDETYKTVNENALLGFKSFLE